MGGNHRGVFFLAAEAAACFGLDDADAIFRQAKNRGECLVDIVRALQGAPDRDAFGGIRAGDDSLGLDVKLLLRAGLILAFDDERSLRPGAIDIALVHRERFEDIVLAPDDFLLCERILDGEDCGQRLDSDAHGAARFFQQIFVGMREKNHRLFRVIHELIREAGLVVDHQRDVVFAGNVLRGDDRKLIPRNAFAEMDGFDPAARDGASHRDAVE